MLANLGGADQQLKRAAEPAALSGHDQIVDAALSRRHFSKRDVAVPGHFPSYPPPPCQSSLGARAKGSYSELIRVKAACHPADPILRRSVSLVAQEE